VVLQITTIAGPIAPCRGLVLWVLFHLLTKSYKYEKVMEG